MSFGGGSSGGGTQARVDPYAPAQPALNQIISDASAIYGQGPQYVDPTTQQIAGLAAQENIAGLANTQIANTISGQYSNPFLSPLIADAASYIALFNMCMSKSWVMSYTECCWPEFI